MHSTGFAGPAAIACQQQRELIGAALRMHFVDRQVVDLLRPQRFRGIQLDDFGTGSLHTELVHRFGGTHLS
jgi:hypothetical protein